MGTQQILQTLKENPDTWYNYKQLIQQTLLSKSNVMRILKQLKKYNEICYKHVRQPKQTPCYYYKHKE